jgi:hypothetical protein
MGEGGVVEAGHGADLAAGQSTGARLLADRSALRQ